MKKLACIVLAILVLTACGHNTEEIQPTEEEMKTVYVNITAQQAKEIMDTQTGYIILDTRTQEEYDQGHIPGAVVISYDEILEKAENVLKKNAL